MNNEAPNVVTLASARKPDSQVVPGFMGDTHPCTHKANALRILHHHGEHVLYVVGIGWHVRDEGAWRHDELAMRKLAGDVGRLVSAEAADLAVAAAAAPKAERDALGEAARERLAWAKQCDGIKAVDGTLAFLAPLIYCDAGEMDADPDVLGCPNGVLDLKTLTLRPYTAQDRLTKVTGAEWNATACAPTWERFVGEIFDGDKELAGYVQRLCGYVLIGRRTEHLLPVFHGGGANGKSTFLGAL
jgi:putative DNA primase/helicase